MSLLSIHRQGSGPRLVWLHGFTQTHLSAQQFRSILAGSHQVETLDLPGHGENAKRCASLSETAELLAESLGDEPYFLGGYSFGARVALHLSLAYPERLHGLIVLSGTRGIFDEQLRRERRQSDEALAQRIETEGVHQFLDFWLSQPMFQSLPDDPVERSSRSHDPSGLACSLRFAGTGTQQWLGERLEEMYVPTLIMAGSEDTKFTTEARALSETLPSCELQLIAGANHAAHLEQPSIVAEAILDFTNRL